MVPPTDRPPVVGIVAAAVHEVDDVVGLQAECRGAAHADDDDLAAMPGTGEHGLAEAGGGASSPAARRLTGRAVGPVRRAVAAVLSARSAGTDATASALPEDVMPRLGQQPVAPAHLV